MEFKISDRAHTVDGYQHESLAELAEPVGYGTKVVQDLLPANRVLPQGVQSLTPVKGKHLVQILQDPRLPI